jgi:phytoene dehydrogenase-like protein
VAISSSVDAIVVGSGPNGLAAAITLARAGRSVLVCEASDTIGGGVRSAELTLPGFVHDTCSSIYPFVPGSPFLRELPLPELVHPPAPLAHPLDDGSAVLLERSLEDTVAGLGEDGPAYRRLVGPVVRNWERLEQAVLGPLLVIPRHPLALGRFGLNALQPAGWVTKRVSTGRARALFAGCAAHSALPLERGPTAAFGLILLAAGHLFGWPFPRGGAQNISDALADHLRSLGGEIETGARVDELPRAQTVLCDLTPRGLLRIARDRLPRNYVRRLERYRYGPGAFKVDYALDAPIPWRAEECGRAGTVHLGGALEEIAASEREPWVGRHAERPFVILAQHTLFDDTRAPEGRHTAWAYCHVPNGSTFDMTERIEAQIERFAPGFRERVLARNVMPPAELERRNPNLVGGDLNGGAVNLWQLVARPAYRTPLSGVYLCSSSTPPGGGVHGMCGHLAARAALRDLDASSSRDLRRRRSSE